MVSLCTCHGSDIMDNETFIYPKLVQMEHCLTTYYWVTLIDAPIIVIDDIDYGPTTIDTEIYLCHDLATGTERGNSNAYHLNVDCSVRWVF